MTNDDDAGKLTDKGYWDRTYQAPRQGGLELEGFRAFSEAAIFAKLGPLLAPGASVLEIGAGDSQWLPYLAGRFPAMRFTGLDYSELGCDRLRQRARDAGVAIDVVCADLFAPDASLQGRFDVVISFGVVEHFENLADVMATLRRYLAPGGRTFTLIPNMSGLVGSFTRWLDRSVYDRHNPHALESFVAGHRAGGLRVEAAAYLVSVHFGVVSSAAAPERRLAHAAYVWATRASKAVNLVEHASGLRLPASRLLSPYLYCIGSHAPVDAGA